MKRNAPRSNHHDVICRLELQVLEEYIITTGNNNGGIGSKMWHEQAIKHSRLYLIRNEKEDNWAGPMSN